MQSIKPGNYQSYIHKTKSILLLHFFLAGTNGIPLSFRIKVREQGTGICNEFFILDSIHMCSTYFNLITKTLESQTPLLVTVTLSQ